jgi:GGDEF domain-containing protein
VPEANLLTRLRGGSFAIVLHDLGPEVTAEALASRLLERASEPWPSGEGTARCAAAGALILSGSADETALALLDRARRALHRAKLRSDGQAR